MSSEKKENLWHEVFDRLNDPTFVEEVRDRFADLLEERATDPERTDGGNKELFAMGQMIREGKKLPRKSGPLTILRGVFFHDGPMEKYDITQMEIDRFDNMFFEEAKKQ